MSAANKVTNPGFPVPAFVVLIPFGPIPTSANPQLAIDQKLMEGKLTVSAEWITPAMAVEILTNYNSHNRKLTKRRWEKLLSKFQRGKYRFNGETVVFDENGILVDGQHRIQAIAEGEEAVLLLVIREVLSEVFSTHGQAGVRTQADVLSVSDSKNVAIRRTALVWHHKLLTSIDSVQAPNIDNEVIQEYEDRTPKIKESAQYAFESKDVCDIPSGVLALLHFMVMEADPIEGEKFLSKFVQGLMVSSGSWEEILRTKCRTMLSGDAPSMGNVDLVRKILAYTFEAFNNSRNEKPTKVTSKTGKVTDVKFKYTGKEKTFPKLNPAE